MTHVIGHGRYKSEVYPTAAPPGGSGAIVRMGTDNSIGAVTYNTGGGDQDVIRANADTPLSVTLTGYKKGNVIKIVYTIIPRDGISSGPAGSRPQFTPTVDLGAGARLVDMPASVSVAAAPEVASTAMSAQTVEVFLVPVPSDVTADPVIALVVTVGGTDPTSISKNGAILAAYEMDATFFTKLPTTVLV